MATKEIRQPAFDDDEKIITELMNTKTEQVNALKKVLNHVNEEMKKRVVQERKENL